MGLRCARSFNRITTTYNSYSISSQHQVVGVTIWVMSQLCWIHSLALDSYVYWMCIPTRPHECCSSQWWSGSSALSQCMWQGQRKTSSDSTQTTVPTWKLLLTNQKASQRSSIRVQSYKRLCITEIKQSVRKKPVYSSSKGTLCCYAHPLDCAQWRKQLFTSSFSSKRCTKYTIQHFHTLFSPNDKIIQVGKAKRSP